MVFPVGGAPDGNNAISWSNAKDLYNGVKGNKEKFIELWSGSPDPNEEIADDYTPLQVFGFLKSMDSDGKDGLSPEEYKAGLIERKDDLKYRINLEWQQFSNYMDLGDFLKLSVTEQNNNIRHWMLDLDIVTDPKDADIESAIWIGNWYQNREKLEAINSKLDEIDGRKNSQASENEKVDGASNSEESIGDVDWLWGE